MADRMQARNIGLR